MLRAVRRDTKDPALVSLIEQEADLPAPRTDHIRGLGVTPDVGWKAGYEAAGVAQDASYFLNKTLVIAAATGAQYVPGAKVDARLYDRKLERAVAELTRRARLEVRLAPALVVAELPFLEHLTPDLLVRVRESEEALTDWRAGLRATAPLIQSSTADGAAFVAEAQSIFQDHYLPEANRVRRAVDASLTLQRL